MGEKMRKGVGWWEIGENWRWSNRNQTPNLQTTNYWKTAETENSKHKLLLEIKVSIKEKQLEEVRG